MAGEIFIADKITLDKVKQDTTFIKDNFKNPSSGGGFNPLDYKDFSNSGSYIKLNKSDSSYKEIFTIKGKGIVDTFLWIGGDDYNKEYSYRLIIDDKIIEEVEKAGGSTKGFVNIKDIFVNKNNEIKLINNKTFRISYCTIKYYPLRFTKNIKLEAKFVHSSDTHVDVEYFIRGGIYNG